MAKFVLPLSGAALLLGVVAVACGTDVVGGVDPQLDGGSPGQDAGKDAANPNPNPDAGNPDAGDPNPTKPSYAIGGSVVGLSGTGLVLQNNGGDDVTVNQNGQFLFTKKIEAGKTFNVTIKTQPTAPSQVCSVSGASGTVISANVNTVVVNCSTNKFTVGGTVSGLAGSGLVLQNNNGDDATIGADGEFAFSTPIDDGAAYAVTIKTQPSNLSQTCTVTNGSGNVAGGKVTGVSITCVTNKFTVGGTVVGLTGSGLVLQNKAGDDLSVSGDAFTFPTSQDDGSAFEVTVKTQPGNPQQNCVVTGGTGTIAGGNVSSVVVNCATDKFIIGGTVSGLDGAGLVLQNNAGDDATINGNGGFSFKTPLDDLAAYAVTVKTQPTNKWQTCAVTNATGNVASANVSNVAVVCTTNSYKVKGTVTGLDGTGLALQNNGGNDLTIPGNGPFEFTLPVESGTGYLVSTLTNPTNKSQTCTVTNGSGTIGGADIEDVAVSCVTNHYTVGGTVTGLAAGNDVVLQNNGGDDLTVNGDGSFTFNGSLESGQSFTVSVLTQPTTPNQTCVVTGDTGTVAAGNIVSVSVNCGTNSYTAGGTVTGLEGTGLVLTNNGVDLPQNGNGSFAFPAQLDGSAYNVTVKTQPTSKSQTCSVTNGSGNLGGANVTNIGVSCTTNSYVVGGNITGLATGSVVLTNNGGNDLTRSANGSFQFSNPIASGATFNVAVKTQPGDRFCTVTNGSGTVTNGAISSVTVTCTKSDCRAVNGLLWCKDTVDNRSCNTFCSAIGLGNPTITDGEWLAAQDETSECSALASAFSMPFGGIGPGYTHACSEAYAGSIYCSGLAACPSNHRTGASGAGLTAVCPCGTARQCGTAGEGGTTTVTCPVGTVIKSIDYASYGTPNGSCGSFTNGGCNASNSASIVSAACVGKNSCSVGANNGVFGDPCGGIVKRLYVQATCE